MDSIFPFMDPQIIEVEENQLPMAREYAWDFDKNDFKLKDGKMYIVEGKEAIKIWLWKLFMTHRYSYLIYSWDYGSELEDLIGKGYTPGLRNAEAERYVREAIEYNLNDYVTEVRNLKVNFYQGKLTIDFIAITPYGEVEISV